MTIEKLRPAFTFTEDRLRQLQQIVPEAFADGKINWEALRQALGEHLEDDAQEHFGLTWPGKREARRLAALPPQGTLVPAPGEGIDEATTHNLFIEGENLEVLKLLQKSYAGRVKLIYIDPPYNTGNDFVYEDDYSEPLEAYLKRTGQMDEAGRMLTTNPRASGRFHSRWLSMIYPRLLLARQLLREDGVIFVSIDDNEVHHLRLVMNEVFGEENFVVQIPWQSRLSVQNDTDISVNHEYIIAYAKFRRQSERRLKESNATEWYSASGFAAYPLPLNPERFSNPDNDPRGPWKADPFDAPNIRPNLTYAIINPNTGEEHWPPPGRHWRMEKEKFEALLSDNRIVFGKSGNSRPQLKVFYNEKKDYGEIQTSWFDGKSYGTTTMGTQELQELFNNISVFDNPKPTKLLKALLRLSVRDNDLILDFFAGSCSIFHAVFEYNLENACNCQVIAVQMPQPVASDALAYQQGFKLVSDIGKERIRRVIRKMKEEATPAGNQPSLVAAEDAPADPLDLGFKVLKLTSSHFKPWTPPEPTDAQTLDGRFAQHASPLVEGWTKDGLLSEILLIEGFPLDSRVIPLEAFTENVVWRVHHADVAHELFVCLDEKIQPATIERLKSGAVLGREDLFICLDSALSDEAKVVLDDRLRLKVI